VQGFYIFSEIDRELAIKKIAAFSHLGEQEELQKKARPLKRQMAVEKFSSQAILF